MTQKQTKFIIEKLKKFTITIDVVLSQQTEKTAILPKTGKIFLKINKNKDFYYLRNFFACREEGMKAVGERKRFFFRSFLVRALFDRRFTQYLIDDLLMPEISIGFTIVDEIKTFQQNIKDFIVVLVNAYQVVLTEKTIKIDFINEKKKK